MVGVGIMRQQISNSFASQMEVLTIHVEVLIVHMEVLTVHVEVLTVHVEVLIVHMEVLIVHMEVLNSKRGGPHDHASTSFVDHSHSKRGGPHDHASTSFVDHSFVLLKNIMKRTFFPLIKYRRVIIIGGCMPCRMSMLLY